MIVKIYDTTEQLRTTAEVYDFRHLHEINKLDVLTGYILEPIEKGERILYKHKTGKWYEFIVDEPNIIHEDGMRYYFTAVDSLVEIDGDWIADKRPTTLSNAVVEVLAPTRWTLGTVTSKPNKLLTFYRITAREALDEVLKTYPVEFQTRITVGTNGVVTRTLDVLDGIGGDYGKRYVYDKDITSVKRTYRQGKIVTALYGYGKGEEVGDGYSRRIDFASINGGLAYVFDPAVLAQYGRMNGGTRVHVYDDVTYDDVADKAELLLLTQIEYLKRSVPQVSYEASAIDLGLAHEQVGIGDTVKVIDGEHRYETRINYLLEEEPGDQVRLATYIRSISDSNNALMDKVGDLASHAGVWDKSQKLVDGSYLNGVLDALNDQANASGGWTTIQDGRGILTIDAPTEVAATKAVNIVGGTIRVASFKNPDGTWKWRTFITGEVIAADMITAGILKGGKVHWNLETGVLYIGNTPETANLRWDGTSLYINGKDIDLSANNSIRLIVGDIQIGGTNLLLNSGFEAGPTGWNKNTGQEILRDGSTDTVYNGKNLLVTCPGGVASSGIYRIYDKFKVGETYTFSAMVYAEDDFWFGTGNQSTATAGGGWKKVQQSFVASLTSHGLYFIFQNSVSDKALYIDDVKLEWGDKATGWSPAPEELITGIVNIGTDGINVARSATGTNSRMAADGLRVFDGSTERIFVGESGSHAPEFTIDNIKGNVQNLLAFPQTLTVNTGAFLTISEALASLGNSKNLNGLVVTINVEIPIIDTVLIRGWTNGILIIKLNTTQLCAIKFLATCNTALIIAVGGKNRQVEPFVVDNSKFTVNGMIIDNSGGDYLATIREQSLVHFIGCDFSNSLYGPIAYGSEVMATDCRGSNITGDRFLVLRDGARGFINGAIRPNCAMFDGSGDRYFFNSTGALVATNSAFSPPAVVPTPFKSIFKAISLKSYTRTGGYYSSHYGNTAAQGKSSEGTTWMEGRITFNTDVANYFAGGTAISVRMRLHRYNSSHGLSAACKPDPDNFSPITWPTGGALQGGWSEWATISSAEFSTTANKEFRFYSGVLDSGYAVWDDAEVEVTVTKNV